MVMKPETIRLLELVSENDRNVSARLAEAFNITRQAASQRVRAAIRHGLIESTGRGPGTRYKLATLAKEERAFQREGLEEHFVWSSVLAPVVSEFSTNVIDIWQYGLTEMINNAIDHSNGTKITVRIEKNGLFTHALVVDDGEGIFLKIQKALSLQDPRESILELAKGKLTTDPTRHTGEGIFFSSKVFDLFDIRSGSLHFMHNDGAHDWLIERPLEAPGTEVFMCLRNDSQRTLKEIFDKFAVPDEYTFAKTVVPVRLAQYEGEKLVSRSQARRLVFRFEKFQTIILDFEGVEEIGQAFADEVFRVFQINHPKSKLVPANMGGGVKRMVSRAKAELRGMSD